MIEGHSETHPGLLSLPDETLVYICRHLHYKDLISLSESCKSLHRLCGDDSLWRWQCNHYFLDNICTEGLSWREHFINLFINFGKYPDYKDFKVAWDKIRRFMKRNCPSIFASLQDGVSEEVLNSLEEKLGHKLPLDFRVSYRLFDGQSQVADCNGLLGGIAISGYRTIYSMLSIAEGNYNSTTEMWKKYSKQGLFLFSLSGQAIFYAFNDDAGFQTGCLYSLFKGCSLGMNQTDFFCLGTLKDWILDYADKLDSNAYFVEEEFIYSLSMSKDVPKSLSSQLETRHWIVTDGTGAEEHVNGPGVVGEHPIMKPGAEFSWISCCTFPTPTGNMRGYFRFRNLATGELTDVECPCYHMEAPTVLTYQERDRIIKQRRLEQAEGDQEYG